MKRLLILGFLLPLIPARADTILVLPFFNESSTPNASNLDWIGESIAHTISQGLVSRGLLVLEREDRAEVYRRLSIRPNAHLTNASVIKVGEALDASRVVYGNFEVTPAAAGGADSRGRIRITAFTLDMARMRKGPEFLESGPLEELAQLQSHLAWRVLSSLAPELAPSAEQFLAEHPPVRLDAMENYTRGLLASNPEQKHRFFTQAHRLDERSSEPAFELGRLYWSKKEYRLAAGWLGQVKPESPRYSEATFLLGLCRYFTGDYRGAQSAFESVAELVPLNEVFNNLGAALSRQNRPEALEAFRKALEGDPGNPDFHFNVGYALWKQGQFDAAADSFRAVLERNPEDTEATTFLGRCLAKTGPRPNVMQSQGAERVKLNFEEGAYRQLKAALEGRKRN
ncbi:MAG: tetratricopeptide repeat protein [Rhodospirillales bacterium]